MIKEYSRFLSLINEENTTDLDSANRVNTYYLSNFVSKGPKIDSLTYFSDSSAREVFKTKLKGYLASDPIEGWGAGASYDKLLFTLDFFLKTRMWNKLVDILYGKDFSGDPLNNDIKLKGIKELYEDIPLQNQKTIYAKDVFIAVWKNVDIMCTNAKTLLSENKAKDTWWGKGRDLAEDILLDLIISIIIVCLWELVAGTIVIGGTAAGTKTVLTRVTQLFQKSKQIEQMQLFKTNPKRLMALSDYVNKTIKDVWSGGASKYIAIGQITQSLLDVIRGDDLFEPIISNSANKLLSGYGQGTKEDKQNFIVQLKSNLEKTRDFRTVWGFRIDTGVEPYRSIQYMPGWKAYTQNKGQKIDGLALGYEMSYWVSFYAYDFLHYVNFYHFFNLGDQNS